MEAPTKELKERILKLVDEDHENFLLRIKDRFDRVGIKGPKIEVRYENLSVEGDVNVGSKSIQTVFNSTLHTIEIILGLVFNFPSKKQKLQILRDVSGIVRPSRMTLLLGPPGSGKSTFLLSLAGKLDNDLRVTGRVTYYGHELNEFVPQRICGFVGQHDLHSGQMTPRETLDFSSHALGIGLRHGVLEEISRRETEAGIEPDPEIDAFMQAKTRASHEARDLITDYILKILGLKKCADTIVGDMMRRGISGGEKKRLSIGEMLVGPARVFLMDEISTGLDSSTTFHICKYLSQMVHISDTTAVISLLQPTPETYDLFDDIILLSEGHLVYQGPRENVLEFFERAGFKCPARKGVAEFLQEVTSKKDQEQYWDHKNRAYNYVSALDFVEDFKSFDVGKKLQADLKLPYNKTSNTSSAFVTNKYGATNQELFKACLSKEWLLMKRSYPLYLLKIVLVLVASVLALTVFIKKEMPAGRVQDGDKFIGAMYFGIVSLVFIAMVEQVMFVMRLPVFFKQRDSLFYPAWAFGLPIVLLRIPLAIIETGLWVALTYYEIGFAPDASRFFKHFLAYLGIYQIGMSLALLTGAVGRIQVVANALGLTIYAISVIVGGFFISKSDFKPWLSWTAYLSPLMYGQNAIVMNEFLDKRWSTPFSVPGVGESTAGKVILDIIGVATEESWFWVCIGALFGFVLLFNILFIAALTYLKREYFDYPKTFVSSALQGSKAFVPDEKSACMEVNSFMTELAKYPGKVGWSPDLKLTPVYKCGMVFPVRPISLAFSHVNYFVDIPAELKGLGVGGDRLQLLRDVSGAFRPGVLTAIVGVSGAGKTTLMDVLAGRKTTGYIEGNITVSGYPKTQETFRRVSGYCEQEDVHSPYITIYETLVFSAWLRLPKNTSEEARTMFIEEAMELVEITSIREALVGLPGVNGLSIEQRKRVKIAMELVANPSIIYMDEPTSGLDARAAAIVMRTLRNTVDKGRTVICTVHQPSIDIFEAFDELVLMKLGGQVIYTGPLGRHSRELIEFYEAVPGVPKIKDGHNPASWVLDITSPESEAQLNVDFAEIYLKSNLYRKNQELVKELTMQVPGSTCLKFPTIYSQPFYVQLKACLWKHHLSYSRNCRHNVTRMYFTIVIGGFLGLVLWNKGQNIIKQQDVMNLLGSIYIAVVFVGGNNANTIQSIVSVERTVFYRERASGMYSALAYALAQVGIETIYTVIQALILSLITFSMFGLKWTVPNFLWFYYFTTMFLTYMTLTGMMVVSLTPTIEASSVFLSFLIRLWNLFTGFFIPRMQIPSWWSWYYWASPMAWTLNGLVTSQLGDNDSDIEVPGVGTIPLKTFLKEKLGYEFGFLPVVALAHLGWVLLFFFMFVFGIKFLNFQKR